MITLEDMPDVKLTVNGNYRQSQPLTLNNLVRLLRAMEVSVRMNVMLRRREFWNAGVRCEAPMAVYAGISDNLKRLDINAQGDLDALLDVLAEQDEYHPMEDWLKSLPPAQGDPLGPLIASVQAEGELWPIAIELWLGQVVEAVCGWRGPLDMRRSLQSCLVLQGPQGVGKTRFFANLGGEWIKTEADVVLGSNTAAEDSQLRTLRWPMVELAELDGMTRRQDNADMKAFLSRPVDDLRRKYAKDAALIPRMTVFGGSVNEGGFITDHTGNRRWLPIRVTSIDWDAEIDYEGVWAQAYASWKENGLVPLTEEEEAVRHAAAVGFTVVVPEVDAIESQLDRCELIDGVEYFALTKRDICLVLGLPTGLQNCQAVQNYMSNLCGPGRKRHGKRNSWPFPLLPIQQAKLDSLVLIDQKDALKCLRWGIN